MNLSLHKRAGENTPHASLLVSFPLRLARRSHHASDSSFSPHAGTPGFCALAVKKKEIPHRLQEYLWMLGDVWTVVLLRLCSAPVMVGASWKTLKGPFLMLIHSQLISKLWGKNDSFRVPHRWLNIFSKRKLLPQEWARLSGRVLSLHMWTGQSGSHLLQVWGS